MNASREKLAFKASAAATRIVNMSADERFNAAVNVIRSLPKDAPFQVSDEVKLKFYAYYKQATEGVNKTSKPPFYDIVNKYKWDAWNKLGAMSKDDAKEGYVEQLKKIIETMSYTDSVAEFYDVLGPFSECVKNDLRTNGNGSVVSHEIELTKSEKAAAKSGKKPTNGHGADIHQMNGSIVIANGDVNHIDSDGDEFSDTYDHMDQTDVIPSATRNGTDADIINARGEADLTAPRMVPGASSTRSSPGRVHVGRGFAGPSGLSSGQLPSGSGSGNGGNSNFSRQIASNDVNEHLALAVIRLQQSMEQVVGRLDAIESRLSSSSGRTGEFGRSDRSAKWWPFVNVSPVVMLMLITWPFVTQFIVHTIRQRRKQ